jgi:hypothetical protein
LNREKISSHIVHKYNPVKHPHANSSNSNYNDDKGTQRQRSTTSAASQQKPSFTVRYFCSSIDLD